MKAVIALIIWTVVLALMSLLPVYEPSTYRLFPNEDKVAHVIMYLIMAFLLGIVLARYLERRQSLAMFWAVVIASGYGYLMEILQGTLNTGRLFDYFDIIANIIGSFAGTMLFYMINTSGKRKP